MTKLKKTQQRLFLLIAAVFLHLTVPAFATTPLMVNKIVIHPNNSKILYAGGRPQGVLKSVDRGKTWFPARTGIGNTSVYHLLIPEQMPDTLYLATFGGGVYKSEDGAASWHEVNNGLGNTNIHALAIDPTNPDALYAGTSTGDLFQSQDGGLHWTPFGEGLPFLEGEVFATLLFDAKMPPNLYLGQESLYIRESKGSKGSWVAVSQGLKKELISTLAIDPENKIYYAGTIRDGLFVSKDQGKSWKSVTELFKKKWIQRIFLDRSKPNQIYVSVVGVGLHKSMDRGKIWEKLDQGLPPGDNIMTLAIDPDDSNRLYVGTHNKGIFVSSDGGATWSAPMIKQEPFDVIATSLISSPPPVASNPSKPLPAIPPAFLKCTKCHGWADTYLTKKKTFWRVPSNRRDWRPTVKRMSPGAGLTPEEQETVIKFLMSYTEAKNGSMK